MVIDKGEQGLAAELIRNRRLRILGINQRVGGVWRQVEFLVIELQVDLKTLHQRAVFVVADLMKAQQRGFDVELFGQELMRQAGSDIIRVRVAHQDDEDFFSMVAGQYLTQFFPLLFW